MTSTPLRIRLTAHPVDMVGQASTLKGLTLTGLLLLHTRLVCRVTCPAITNSNAVNGPVNFPNWTGTLADYTADYQWAFYLWLNEGCPLSRVADGRHRELRPTQVGCLTTLGPATEAVLGTIQWYQTRGERSELLYVCTLSVTLTFATYFQLLSQAVRTTLCFHRFQFKTASVVD